MGTDKILSLGNNAYNMNNTVLEYVIQCNIVYSMDSVCSIICCSSYSSDSLAVFF